MTNVSDSFDTQERLAWARDALGAAAAGSANNGGQVPPDLIEPDGWRWRVLSDIQQLSGAVSRDYARAKSSQQRQAWESRFAGPVATGGGAAVGSIVSAVGAGLTKTSAVTGGIVIALGVLFAIAGSVFSANNYVRNRSQRLRFLRLLHDIWDFAYLVLPTAAPAEAFTQLGVIRTEWETAGG